MFNGFGGVSYIAGGWLSGHARPRDTFLGVALLSALFLPIGLWRPQMIFAGRADEPLSKESTFQEAVRFVRHHPIWPGALIWLLWCFAPAPFTPLLFYLTNTIGATTAQYGLFMGLFCLAFVPTAGIYAALSKRHTLRTLLWGSTLIAIPQMVPLLFIRTPAQSLVVGVLLGVLGGVANAAYIDLVLRSCARGLEGTGAMMLDAGFFVALRFGDLFGAWLYARGGFALAVWVTTAVYASILFVLLFLPRQVTGYVEGEVDPANPKRQEA